ncbi:hypothetical protein N665_0027s0031 [Sinapis alba]|nr:hypothetical protein N665_0027s0031 [Sinapis alba]
MSINMKTFAQALDRSAAVIEKTVQTTVQKVTGPKPLQDYEILDQIGSAGPGLAWKLYAAKARDTKRSQQYPTVCVWMLDKRVFSEARVRAGLSKSAEDAFLDLIRADAGKLVRLRHPGVVHVDSMLPVQPSLNYTAPELVHNKNPSAGALSDISSFGCLAYHLVARKPLLDCNNNVKMDPKLSIFDLHAILPEHVELYKNESFSSIPSDLVSDLQRMLSTNETFRPTALDFTCKRTDARLRALRFLDHLLERDNMQKSEFLKALSDRWKDFDSCVLRYKVLPPLCAELRNLVLQPIILPMVLTIAQSQDRIDFELITLPALVPVLSTASDDTLLLLVKHAELITNKTDSEHLVSHVLPLLLRAYSDNNVRIQEEVIKRSTSVAKQLDGQVVKESIFPRVHGLALKTTVVAVRVNALLCLAELVQTLDKPAVIKILQTVQRCTTVDRSAPTLMCTLAIKNAILKQYGVEFTTEHVLSLMMPLLTAQQLNVQPFAKYMLFVKDILRKIEEKEELHFSPRTKRLRRLLLQQRAVQLEMKIGEPSTMSTLQNKATSLTTCPPMDIVWPPRQSSSLTAPAVADETQLNTGKSSTPGFHELDPFANWPPRPKNNGAYVTSTGSLNNGTLSGFSNNFTVGAPFQIANNDNWAFSNASLSSMKPPQQRNPIIYASNQDFGLPKQSQGMPSFSSGSNNNQKPANISSIFNSRKTGKPAMKLAPPPSTTMGRGRGRGRGGTSKPNGSQTSLLNLL